MTDQREPLALREAAQQYLELYSPEDDFPERARLRAAVGPASPGRDPAPPDTEIDAFVYTLMGIPWEPPTIEHMVGRRRVVREFLWRVRGVRDPSPPDVAAKKIAEWRALAAQVREDLKGEIFEGYDRLDVKRRMYDACADDLEAALGVRGSGVVPSAPSLDEQQAARIAALEAKHRERDLSNEKGA